MRLAINIFSLTILPYVLANAVGESLGWTQGQVVALGVSSFAFMCFCLDRTRDGLPYILDHTIVRVTVIAVALSLIVNYYILVYHVVDLGSNDVMLECGSCAGRCSPRFVSMLLCLFPLSPYIASTASRLFGMLRKI